MSVRPLEVLTKAAVEDVGVVAQGLRQVGWDAKVEVWNVGLGRAEVRLVVTLPEVLVPVEATSAGAQSSPAGTPPA